MDGDETDGDDGEGGDGAVGSGTYREGGDGVLGCRGGWRSGAGAPVWGAAMAQETRLQGRAHGTPLS